eukprot:UN0643
MSEDIVEDGKHTVTGTPCSKPCHRKRTRRGGSSQAGVVDLLQVAVKDPNVQLLREVYPRRLASGPLGEVGHDHQDLWAPLVLQDLARHEPLPELEQLDRLALVEDGDNAHGLAQHLVLAGEAQDVLDGLVFE